jgi:hypothetical protein
MTLVELAQRETELSRIPSSLEGTIEQRQERISQHGINVEYRTIFNEYAALSDNNIEALKRGLFLMWFCHIEPTFISGLDYFDIEQERKIIVNIETYFNLQHTDYELEWMFSYYISWHFLFDYKEFPLFHEKLLEFENKSIMPNAINRETMEERGQMGEYWNSLDRFT